MDISKDWGGHRTDWRKCWIERRRNLLDHAIKWIIPSPHKPLAAEHPNSQICTRCRRAKEWGGGTKQSECPSNRYATWVPFTEVPWHPLCAKTLLYSPTLNIVKHSPVAQHLQQRRTSWPRPVEKHPVAPSHLDSSIRPRHKITISSTHKYIKMMSQCAYLSELNAIARESGLGKPNSCVRSLM